MAEPTIRVKLIPDTSGISAGMAGTPAGITAGFNPSEQKKAAAMFTIPITDVLSGILKGVQKMAEASPQLAASLDLFKKGMFMAIRPIADIFAQLIRPMAMVLIRFFGPLLANSAQIGFLPAVGEAIAENPEEAIKAGLVITGVTVGGILAGKVGVGIMGAIAKSLGLQLVGGGVGGAAAGAATGGGLAALAIPALITVGIGGGIYFASQAKKMIKNLIDIWSDEAEKFEETGGGRGLLGGLLNIGMGFEKGGIKGAIEALLNFGKSTEDTTEKTELLTCSIENETEYIKLLEDEQGNLILSTDWVADSNISLAKTHELVTTQINKETTAMEKLVNMMERMTRYRTTGRGGGPGGSSGRHTGLVPALGGLGGTESTPNAGAIVRGTP